MPSDRRRIVFLNRFYRPDSAATAQMLGDLAEDLAASGWHVTVVASDASYGNHAVRLPAREMVNGVQVLRTWGPNFGRHALVGRVFDYAAYYAGSLRYLSGMRRQDIVVAMTDPPLILLAALVVGKLRGWKCVYWVQDMFPQIAGALGVLRPGGLVYRLAERLTIAMHGSVDLIVALGPRMRDKLASFGAAAPRVVIIHNWADAEDIRPVSAHDNPFIRKHELEGKAVVLYSGNAGRAHRFDGVMEAARQLRQDPSIVFVFIGEGNATLTLRGIVEREELFNVRFIPSQPREELSNSLSSATVSLVTENPSVVGLLLPSKTYGILASGRPIAFMGARESDVASIVNEAECGVTLMPGDGVGLAEFILRLKDDSGLAERLGANARRAAEERFSRTISTNRWAEALSYIV